MRLAVHDLTVSGGGFDIIRDCSLQATEGQVLAILGPNGAGKTTLLKTILGLLRPRRGHVLINGQVLEDPLSRARAMAYVPQHSQLSAHLSAREVVELGRFPHRGARLGLGERDRQVITQSLEMTDCSYLQQRRFATSSGGEQARLLIARALATEAPLLLLDEPAASLDIAHRLRLYALLRRLAGEGKTILVVMHQLEDALAWADVALLMDNGRVVGHGPPPAVLTAQVVREVYGVEMSPAGGVSFQLPGNRP